MTLSLPNPNEDEGQVTPVDVDIPISITITLFDALQERRTGNNFPPTVMPVARIRATLLRQRLFAGKWPSDSTIQANLDLISLVRDTSGLAPIADRVPTGGNIFECTTN